MEARTMSLPPAASHHDAGRCPGAAVFTAKIFPHLAQRELRLDPPFEAQSRRR